MELVTGRKAVDINRPKGEQCLTEWVNTIYTSHENLIVLCFNHLTFIIFFLYIRAGASVARRECSLQIH